MCRRRATEMGECLGLHFVIRAAVRVSGHLETYSSRGPPCASARGTCSIIFTSDGLVAIVTVAVSRSPPQRLVATPPRRCCPSPPGYPSLSPSQLPSPSQPGEPFVPDLDVSASSTDYAQLRDRYEA